MNRKLGVQIIAFVTTFLFILTCLSPTIQSIPPITQETLIVDINGTGDYTSIQEAIRNANATDIIIIRKGTYKEHNLNIDKKIEIIGDDPDNTIINCSGNPGLTLSSSYVDISNLKIIDTGEYAIYIPSESKGCTISNCVINKLNKGTGIDIKSSYNTISDCNLYGFDRRGQGIKIHGSNNIIKNCNIQKFSNGILALWRSNNNNILNCNILNNENAVDIRLNSNNNLISSCNIYSNLQSIKIWQGSNNNSVYHNNLFENDVGAIDESSNSWDNGREGNYWDDYLGQDTNGDGIGDTPYIISEENRDAFPIMTVFLPDLISVPTGIKHVTGPLDNTPSFIWNPSFCSKGISGYYVKIDSNPETFIGDTTTWTSTYIISNGVHTFYVRAESKEGVTSDYSSITFSIDSSLTDTDQDGWSDEEEQAYGTDPNEPDNYPLDTDGDHIPDSIDTDDDNDGYSDDMETSYRTDPKDSNNHPTDTDNDKIPNDDSPDGKYTGDTDDDGDGLTDTIETTLGSNPQYESDVNKLYISGKPCYLVDISQNGFYDVLYDPISETTNAIEKKDDKQYLIDQNGDGSWDHIYSITDKSVSTYTEEQQLLQFTLWILLILIIITIPLITLYYIRNKPKDKKHIKTEKTVEQPEIKEPLRIHTTDKKDTKDMTDEMRTPSLHTRQDDVTAYTEQIYRIIDEQTETTTTFPKTSKSTNIQDIESDVDKLLSKLD